MDFWNAFASLFSNFGNLTWQMVVMWGIGALLIYLAIAKKMEPSLLLPMGFGAILVNLPLSGAITQGDTVGPISALFEAGMSNELFPLLLFIGIGAMIDFGPLLEKPWLMLFGAAAQFGIFFTLFLAGFFFDLKDAASIAVIGAADGPTAIFVANVLHSQYLGRQLEQIRNGEPRISGLTWHHTEHPGVMQLVNSNVHSMCRHTGGRSIWGGGSDCR